MLKIGKNCRIHPSVEINVKDGFIGDGSTINAGVVIEGTLVEIGREAFIDRGSYIGGGSSFSNRAFLKAGDWLHMGINSHINTAEGVVIGDTLGLGVNSKIFTHGAYLDSFNLGAPSQWAPVKIGNNVWLPNAWVNPGVTIGNNVVVSALSLINRNLPSGVLAGGVPVKILKENYYPRELSELEKSNRIEVIIQQLSDRPDFDKKIEVIYSPSILKVIENKLETIFDLTNLKISGDTGIASQIVKDQLRRHGIRFKYYISDGGWERW